MAVAPCSALATFSGGTVDSDEGEAGVGEPVAGDFSSAKNLYIEAKSINQISLDGGTQRNAIIPDRRAGCWPQL